MLSFFIIARKNIQNDKSTLGELRSDVENFHKKHMEKLYCYTEAYVAT